MDVLRADTASALPVACTLGPQDGPARILRWQRLIETAHAAVTRRAAELEVRFDAGSAVAAELSELVAAERECCAFVTWSVETTAAANVVRVRADPASPDDVDTIAALFAAG